MGGGGGVGKKKKQRLKVKGVTSARARERAIGKAVKRGGEVLTTKPY